MSKPAAETTGQNAFPPQGAGGMNSTRPSLPFRDCPVNPISIRFDERLAFTEVKGSLNHPADGVKNFRKNISENFFSVIDPCRALTYFPTNEAPGRSGIPPGHFRSGYVGKRRSSAWP
jgi:hypothetical protein